MTTRQHARTDTHDSATRVPAASASLAGGRLATLQLRPRMAAQRKHLEWLANSPRVAAQRRQLAQMTSPRAASTASFAGPLSGAMAQAKFWSPQWKAIGHGDLIRMLNEQSEMHLSREDALALAGMAAEDVEYQLPENAREWEGHLRPLIHAYHKQDRINLTKLFSIINSVLNHGILNQKDRNELLGSGNRASTSTDSVEGSEKIHGMMLNQPEDKRSSAQQSERESVNVLGEVKDDVLFQVARTRLGKGLLMREERQVARTLLTGSYAEVFKYLHKESDYQELLEKLEDDSDVPTVVDLRMQALKDEVRRYTLERIANSRRGQNEMQKRMMSGFLTILDANQLDSWDARPTKGQTGEGTLTKSQPANKILTMVLPKYLEHYQDRIVNPHSIEIVFQHIDYPVTGEVHVYFPNGDRINLRNEIDLNWYQQIEASLHKYESVFTHMVRGF
jgi:hypothetical protein